ncbi:MAG TPA: hypothetical protein PK760_13485, partial [Flavobacteriales bacterium]|nr:hypothetical protein [Flavobacteriales bacterium]
MINFLRTHWQLILVIFTWLAVGYYFQQAVFLMLPLSVFFFKERDLWPEMFFGMLIVFVLSDIEKDMFVKMIVFKDAKNFYVLAVAMLFFLETKRFAPLSQVFTIFLPFFIYSIFPLVFSNSVVTAVQKTLSYALIYLLVPNFMLYSYRRWGWDFMRNLVFFMVAILLYGFVMQMQNPIYSHVAGRFRGIFGNPNGMAIYCYLLLTLAGVISSIKKDLFTWHEKVMVFGTIIYFIIASGSRASLTSAAIFIVFNRFFSTSPFIGFVGLVSLIMAA